MSYKDESQAEREARWQRLLSMTDEENDANIASDPDSQVPIEALRQGMRGWLPIKRADGSMILPIELDATTSRWLADHHMDHQPFLSGVIKAFIESQQQKSAT